MANTPRRPISRGKLWAFRLAAAVGIPLLMFLLLEGALRIVGFGYSTSFFLPRDQDGKQVLVENDKFGWRVFGPRLARVPNAVSIPVEKPKDTVRICVFGESAAFGDPQPDYGLPRMLAVMLSARHPGLHFEVINAAMTGINSHTVREIAHDSLATNSDVWVVYMGNNEVIGPFGAGTVFGTKTPPLSLVRANLTFKKTRLGQIFERMLPSAAGATTGDEEWGGMQMFLKNQVARDDPRMATVYHHFERNLADIIELGRQNNVGVVVSTVAVNLKDCAPFASVRSTKLSPEQAAVCEQDYLAATAFQDDGNIEEALRLFELAGKVDDEWADLNFRWGRALLKAGNVAEARRRLQLACDLDQLRFRCDSELNARTRQIASGRNGERVRFVDAAEEFNVRSTPPIVGRELFYEHVHLKFEGTYLLARLLAEQVEMLLPEDKQPGPVNGKSAEWPTRDECAERLAWNPLAHANTLNDMLMRLDDPPFTAQLNHREQLQDCMRQLTEVTSIDQAAVRVAAIESCRRAIALAPEDHVLYSQLAMLLGQSSDLEGSLQAAQQAAKLLPHSATKQLQLGLVLGMLRRDGESQSALETGLEFDPASVVVRHELAKALVRSGQRKEAIQQLERTVEINPRYGPAYLMLSIMYREDNKTAEADASLRKALENRLRRPDYLTSLAQVCSAHGWVEEAAASYQNAIRLAPSDASLRLAFAQCLDKLKKPAEAEREYRQLLELAPQSAQAHYAFGVHYARREDHAHAAEQFGAAAQLQPTFINARVDYAMALIGAGRDRDALVQFNEILAIDPKHATALEYKAALEKELGQKQ